MIVFRPTTLLLLLALTGCTKKDPTPTSQTLPLDIEVKENNFAIIGDYGENGEPERLVAEMVKSWHPDFIITTGDNNYPYGELSTIKDNIGKHYGDFIYNPDAPLEYQCTGRAATDKTNYFFPTPGNHDYGDSHSLNAYLDYFSLPGSELFYDFTWGPVHLFSIDSGEYGTNINQSLKDSLEQKIATSSFPFKLVYFHYPPYSSGQHGNSPGTQWDFAGWGASAVISGHDHIYEHLTRKSDTQFHYLVNGLGGRSPIYSCNTSPVDSSEFDAFCYDGNFGAIKATASSQSIILSFYSIENGGTLIDQVVLDRQ